MPLKRRARQKRPHRKCDLALAGCTSSTRSTAARSKHALEFNHESWLWECAHCLRQQDQFAGGSEAGGTTAPAGGATAPAAAGVTTTSRAPAEPAAAERRPRLDRMDGIGELRAELPYSGTTSGHTREQRDGALGERASAGRAVSRHAVHEPARHRRIHAGVRWPRRQQVGHAGRAGEPTRPSMNCTGLD